MRRENRLLVLAVVCAAAAALLTFRAGAPADVAEGPMVDVVVAGAPLAAGRALDDDDVAALTIRPTPRSYAPPDALGDPLDALGARPRADLPAGTPLTGSQLIVAGGEPQSQLRSGERAVSLEVVVSPQSAALTSGSRVDLVASGFGGDQQTAEVIRGAEVLEADDAGEGAKRRITVRLGRAQVAPVVRADVFAQELRAVRWPDS